MVCTLHTDRLVGLEDDLAASEHVRSVARAVEAKAVGAALICDILLRAGKQREGPKSITGVAGGPHRRAFGTAAILMLPPSTLDSWYARGVAMISAVYASRARRRLFVFVVRRQTAYDGHVLLLWEPLMFTLCLFGDIVL